MQVVLLGNEQIKQEWLSAGGEVSADVVWVNDVQELVQHRDAGAFIDLLFEAQPERIARLRTLLPKVVVVNSVADTLAELDASFIRINGWPTFLSSKVIEGSCLHTTLRTQGEEVFAALGKEVEWLPDEPGLVTPRVISMIINEAYLALQEGVSTPEEINTAMKLGTNYPFGPFEWSRRIGVQHIVTLLHKLSRKQPHYHPCDLLVQETDKAI